MSWNNLMMDFASIPDYSEKKDDTKIVSEQDEISELRKDLGMYGG